MLQPAKNYTSTILTAIREANELEQGTVHITPSGVFELQPRGLRTGWTSQVTFGDDAGESPYTGLRLAFDDDQIWNLAEIDIVDGDHQTSFDTPSAATFGQRVYRQQSTSASFGNDVYSSFTIPDTSFGPAESQAETITDIYAVPPQVRVENMTFMPHKDPTVLWPAALGLDVGAKITVKRRPPAGNTITVDCYIEGIEHRVTPGEPWETTWRLSQYS
jgi:hypothetical protein